MYLTWRQIGVMRMTVNLSIKNVPDDLVWQLRRRATANHRSLQGELMAIIEENVRAEGRLSPGQVLKKVQQLGLNTPTEATDILRADRNAR